MELKAEKDEGTYRDCLTSFWAILKNNSNSRKKSTQKVNKNRKINNQQHMSSVKIYRKINKGTQYQKMSVNRNFCSVMPERIIISQL